jgi:monothiol glutaredoxin|tara:strand:+ start:178 stop:501 length:324 start_codon:yes stop_codon:yes gene_type:complete
MSIENEIKEQIESNPILLYMKGSPDSPQCGFSSRASQLLISCGKPFSFVDILTNPEIRTTLPSVSDWPTFPQLFINGELIGGSDIMNEMFDSGDLQKAINQVEIPES